ncbi:hypothetical protein C0J56_11000 [Pseudomonas fluorescens]|nr:hypothetical protein C0J56_11000 [Pseudomonas fluorescens]
MGAGLLAKGPAHSTSMQTDPPPSRASPLPHWICGERQSCNRPRSLWERACSRRGRHIQHRCKLTTAFASKPAPTLDLW